VDNVKTVVFDLGRVLVGIDYKGEKFISLMRSAGITAGEAFDKFWFLSEVRQHMTGEITPREFHRRATARFGVDIPYEEFVEGWCDLFHPVPEMKALFDEIAGRYDVGLLSDTDPLHWEKILEMYPWLRKIEKPTLSFNVGCLKPHPDIYAAAAADCGRAKEECLFIDDKIENVDGARYCGMPALHFTSVEKLRRDLAGLNVL
jgi:putative hydrolase of the HAD superfamily